MRNEKVWPGFRLLAVLFAVAAPSVAVAHTVMMTPPPRDVGLTGADAHKTGPCGGVARTNKCTQYDAGATINVKWVETVSHSGCFQIALSKANDTNFTVLKQIADGTNPVPMVFPDTVTLPAGYTCADCTLSVRQLMIGTCAPDASPNSTSATDTYFSCADVRIGDFPDAAPCEPAEAAEAGADAQAPEDDAGIPVTVPSDGGGNTTPPDEAPPGSQPPNLHNGDGGGCSIALGASSGATFGITAGLLALAILRRRRNKK